MMPTQAEFAAVVERVMCEEGWVCNPAAHGDGIPQPGVCIDCDHERNLLGHRIYAHLEEFVDRVTPPGEPS